MSENGNGNGSRFTMREVLFLLLGVGSLGSFGGVSLAARPAKTEVVEEKADRLISAAEDGARAIKDLTVAIQKDGLTARQAQESRIDALEAEILRLRRTR
jgi:hypothetical protein